jgi:hypothetical protein
MKISSRFYILPAIIISLLLIFQSCGPGKAGIWKNDQISPNQQSLLHQLNDQLYLAFKANNRHDVEDMMSKELIETPGNARQIELISNQSKLGKYNIFDEYYIVNQHHGDKQNVKIVNKGKGGYTLKCRAVSKEMYIAMFIPKTNGEKSMLTLIYCKLDYGWKLTKMELEPYTLNRKTSSQLLEQAKQLRSKGYLIDAMNNIDLANKCAQPNEIWEDPQQAEINELYRTLAKQVNDAYTFPMVITDVPTKPRIFNIINQTLSDGIYPDIYYISDIDIKDTVALHKESTQVKQTIGHLLPGINKDKKYILFSVFNQKPTATKSANSFDITEKL